MPPRRSMYRGRRRSGRRVPRRSLRKSVGGYKRKRTMRATTRRAIRPRTMKPSVYPGALNSIATVADYRGGTRVTHTEYLGDIRVPSPNGCVPVTNGINYAQLSFPFSKAIDQTIGDYTPATPVPHTTWGRYYAPAAGGNFPYAGVIIPLNAGLIAKWLGSIACNYELYKFNKLVFYFRSTSGTTTNAGSATTSGSGVGTVMMAVQYDEYDNFFNGPQAMQLTEGCTVGVPYQNLKLDVLGVKTNKALPLKHLYVRTPNSNITGGTNPTITNTNPIQGAAVDLRFSDLGMLTVAYKGLPAGQTGAMTALPEWTMGELWCEYDVSLYKPLAGPALAATSAFSAVSAFTTSSSSAVPQYESAACISCLAGGSQTVGDGSVRLRLDGSLAFSKGGWYSVDLLALPNYNVAGADASATIGATDNSVRFAPAGALTLYDTSYVISNAPPWYPLTYCYIKAQSGASSIIGFGGYMTLTSGGSDIVANQQQFGYKVYVQVQPGLQEAVLCLPPPSNPSYSAHPLVTGQWNIYCTVQQLPNSFGLGVASQ